MNSDMQIEFMYLFERIGEPLAFGPRGAGEVNLSYYNVPPPTCEKRAHAAMTIQQGFPNVRRNIRVDKPTTMPDLTLIGACCPKTILYSYFNPAHRRATTELKAIFNRTPQGNLKELLAVASACRDSDMVNSKVWLNAFASSILTRGDTRGFKIPAFWEIMPDEFVSTICIKQAQRQVLMPEVDRAVVVQNSGFTGRNTNPENKLWYFREDMGINSHHWHWHLIYTLDDPPGTRDRKGELFYYMHHAMIARYEAERLSNGLTRTKVLNLDEPITEGYFSKLTDTNSGLIWGSRQANTKISDVDRTDDPGDLPLLRLTLEDLRKFKDRILEAIDTGLVIRPNGAPIPINIDILGDIMESTILTPHPQFYSDLGFHNMGHIMLAFAHDPKAEHEEQQGPMADTTTAMRDPVFYRWHKLIDNIFDSYKRTLQPYTDVGGDFPLRWDKIEVQRAEVNTNNIKEKRPNVMITFWMRSDVDLSRGLDFSRNTTNNLGPVWSRITHLNYDAFTYTITVRNTGSAQRATVRIYMAPRFNEHGDRFTMEQQRLLFFELDKFTTELKAGSNQITRKSTDSSITIPWEQTFRQLEGLAPIPTPQQAVCGCGWPQHMLLPKGTAEGMVFDLVIFLTSGTADAVQSKRPPASNCKESLSFCGILNDLYPDKKPMGYPFDRNPFTVPGPATGPQVPIPTLERYVERIPNMRAIQVRVVHMPNRIEIREGGAPKGIREINGDPSTGCAPPSPGSGSGGVSGGNEIVPTSQAGRTPQRSGRDYSPASPETSMGWTEYRDSSRTPSPPGWHSGYY